MPTLLVPLDGSPLAEAVLPVAIGLARHMHATLCLTSVLELSPWRYATGGAPLAETQLVREHQAEWRTAISRYLDGWHERIAALPDAPEVTTSIVAGPVVECLLQHALDVKATVIVLTTHGRGGISGVWMGSITEALVRQAPVPVLAVRPGPQDTPETEALSTWTPRRVLVPLDGTLNGEQVLTPLRSCLGDAPEYVLMRAVSPLAPILRAIATGEEYERDLVQQRGRVAEYLTGTEARLRATGLNVSHCAHVELDPPRGINDCAVGYNVDLIALATHGRGPVGRFLLGSVADKVLRTADRPVLLFRIVAPESS
ncbi:MAG: universal stress protein [Gemmatimonas sp.]|jgi:nucleotide-binding universal stress UspA family protein|uniref:universal stress protein n=1 Tax=Gemmatimonas sp. TaxID=1962908 RepID=UPI0031C89D23|nr:universal stress protein [Gemmatimonas sp.]